MHILNISQAGDLYGDPQPVDLEQSAGDFIFLSATDTDIQLFSAAAHQLDKKQQTINDRLRIANIAALNHPYSIDLYLENTCKQAKLIVIRLLGGVNYWRYGVEQFHQFCAAKGIKLALLPADGKPDPELSTLSTLDADSYHLLFELANQGGIVNACSFLSYGFNIIAPEYTEPEPPSVQTLLQAGIYWPDADLSDLNQLKQQHWIKGQPVAALIFYRALLLAGDLKAVDGMIAALKAQGLNPLPLYVSSLKNLTAAAMIDHLLKQSETRIMLNATAFALQSAATTLNDQALTDHALNEAPYPLNAVDAPILQLSYSASSVAHWQENMAGMNSRELAMNVVLPELDGRIYTRIAGFKTAPQRDSLTQAMVVRSIAHPENANFIAGLAANFVRLQTIPEKAKKLAIMLANYPNKDGRIANGVGLDTPQSVFNVLHDLKQAGYHVIRIPKTAQHMMEMVQAGVTNQAWKDRNISVKLSLDDYDKCFKALPIPLQQAVTTRWGAPANDPNCDGQHLILSVLQFGNVQLVVQPARGYQIDPKATYHSPDLVPPHHYFACYYWLREHAKIDAIIHFGKHGNLEWLPGKAVALSDECYPQAILGATPQFYPFIINDPGEATQAKRRTSAVILGHLTPPLTQAGTHGDAARLEALMDEYYEAQGLDQKRQNLIQQEILELCTKTGIAKDCGIDQSEAALDQLLKLDNYLCDVKELQIRDGLHIYGTSPAGAHQVNLLAAILRNPRGQALHHHPPDHLGLDQSLLRAIANDFDLNCDPLTLERALPYAGARPELLIKQFTAPWRSNGDMVERLDMIALKLIAGEIDPRDIGSHTSAIITHYLPRLTAALDASGALETANLLKGLAGGFIPSGASGAPTRGKPEILPTGRNFYSMDNRALPTEAAWRLGQLSAAALIERFVQDHGDWPKSMILSAWGTSNMRTGGDDIAQALALLGVQPVWEQATRRVTGFEVIPLSVLDRPRVDVTLRCSGFFRDGFPAQMALLDRAIKKLMDLDEPEAMNPLIANQRADYDAFIQAGLDEGAAKQQSLHRIFCAKPGSYGAGLQALMDENLWQERKDFGDQFINWSSYAYGEADYGSEARKGLEKRLVKAQAIIHNQDNREHDLLDSDDYYQFEGGIASAIYGLTGKNAPIYHNDHSLPERPVIRSLSEEIGRVIEARATNPKWIDGVKRHGYKGAFEIAATVDYLFAFSATTGMVADHHFTKCFDAYLMDQATNDFLELANPNAHMDIMLKFKDALDRGLWRPERNSIYNHLENLIHQKQQESKQDGT
ncbi:MAG: cobaltochelatase subunit CobN [Alphaproteobacteria bacterium]